MSIFRKSRARFCIELEPNNYFIVYSNEVENLGAENVLSMLRASVFWSRYLDSAFIRWVDEDLKIQFSAKYYQPGKELI